MTKYPKAHRAWWGPLCMKGDPLHRPNLVSDAFEAGYEAGARAALILIGEHAKAGNKLFTLEDRAGE